MGSVSMAGHVMASLSNLCIFPFLNGLFHGLQGVTGKFGGHNEFPVNVLDFFHHVRLKFGEGFMESMDALQDSSRRFGMDMCAGAAFAAERFEDCVEKLDCR